MKHARHKIRDTAVQVLTGLETTADRVYAGRTRALASGHSPTLLVYTVDEGADIAAGGKPPLQSRRLTLRVEGRVQSGATTDPEDQLDDIAAEVETQMLGQNALLSIVESIELSRTQINMQAAGEAISGAIALDFDITYRTAEGAPSEFV